MKRKNKNIQNDTGFSSRIGKGICGAFLNTIMIIFSFSCIFPLLWMLSSSLKEKRAFNADIMGLPKEPTFENYISLFTNPDYQLGRSVFNSIIITILSVALIVLFGFIIGYMISRVKFKGSKIIYGLFLLGMLIPIHSLLVPMYILFTKTNLSNQWFTLLFPYVALGLPIAIFLIDGFVKGIPVELEEAAAIDGSSFSRTLFTIMLPICRPILSTVGIIQSFACWNEFSFALVLIKDKAYQTVPLALTQFTGQFSSNYPKIMAAMLLTMLPVVVFYFMFSKQIIKGMVAGAVKG